MLQGLLGSVELLRLSRGFAKSDPVVDLAELGILQLVLDGEDGSGDLDLGLLLGDVLVFLFGEGKAELGGIAEVVSVQGTGLGEG